MKPFITLVTAAALMLGGVMSSTVSPRRYFCLQCHVPQTDAKPVVENTFKPADGFGQ
ncbi:hypothetical protein E05_25870 [Plautia stali symbiont]|nr:hypothetical protein E05_25870 [Plautia stali symbiont]